MTTPDAGLTTPDAGTTPPGRAPTPGRVTRLFELVPVGLAVLAEAAWIAIVAGLVQEYALRSPVLELPAMLGFVVIGLVAGRVAGRRWPNRWPAIGALLVFGGALAGLLADPSARAALARGDIGGTVAANPGGLLAGLAVLRGYPHAGPRRPLDAAARTLFLGIPLIALAAAAAELVAEPWHAAFVGAASVDAVIFVASGLLALALSAVADAGRTGAVGWHANPLWLVLVTFAVAGLLVVAIPIAAAGGPSIAVTLQAVVAASLIPLTVVGLALGGRSTLRRVVVFGAVAFAIAWVLSTMPPAARQGGSGGAGGAAGAGAGPTLDPVGAAGIGGIGFLVVAVVVVVLIRLWMRRSEGLPDDADDEHLALPVGELADRPASAPRRPRRWFGEPRTAAAAYVALVDELRDVPDIRRLPRETPAEHARRLREDGLAPDSGLRLDLLAADYGLAAYGGRAITATETRRAIDRWRELRRTLRIRPEPQARRRVPDEDRPPNPLQPQRRF